MGDADAAKWKSQEWKRIRLRRDRAFGEQGKSKADSSTEDAEPKNLVGLSLSGGGIRSAIYNDGFLQGLSHRGFLRYVDYLCSVSGGGYIAGHLISQVREPVDKEGAGFRGFHDDKDRCNLGRDPITGKISANRLAGVGGYLSRTLDFLPAYLWSFFFSFAFYLGTIGIVATLAALFWRSFDDPTFRSLYFGTLGLIKGNELTVAFIPAILLFVLATGSEAALLIWRVFFGFERPIAKSIHSIVRKSSLVLILLAILTSIAIFIGNGKTNVSSNSGGELFLNNYAQILAISAGIIQILVFLGRDRLFRSERAEAKQWQKHLQRSVTTVVLLFLIFSMVHWMGREDISAYTQNRDPHLVRGDVTNWYLMDELFSSYESALQPRPEAPSNVTSLNPLDEVPEYAKPSSRWIAYLAAGVRVKGWSPERDLSQPPSPLQQKYKPAMQETAHKNAAPTEVWSLLKRIEGALFAYWRAMTCWDEEDVGRLLDDHYKQLGVASGSLTNDGADNASIDKPYAAFDGGGKETNKSISIHDFVEKAFINVHVANRIQDERLRRWNEHLQTSEFTSFLAEGRNQSENPTDPNKTSADASSKAGIASLSGSVAPSEKISKLSAATDAKLTDVDRKNLLDSFRRMDLEQSPESDELPSQLLATASANRLLLELLFPGAVQKQQVASTLVVPPHDQRARWRWLCIWVVVALVGMIGGLSQNHIATVFQFYRLQLGTNFLVATHDRSQQFCHKQLCDLNPTADGLPYPLFLAATLEPITHNGSYQVEATPFVLSPLYCGRFDAACGPIPSAALSFSASPVVRFLRRMRRRLLDFGQRIRGRFTGVGQSSPSSNPVSGAVTLGDAITLSGAAVTPLMTGNRWLSVILDFFNTGIGQRLQRLDCPNEELRPRWARQLGTWGTVVTASAIIAMTAHILIGFGLLVSAAAGSLTFLAGYCIVMRLGSPGLICSLVAPRNRDGNINRGDGDHAPRSFYVADGGFYDYLGVSELLQRRCELIVVSDTGANVGNDPLGTLAKMCEKASQEMGIRFLDLDHEAPIDFGRLKLTEQRLVHQPYLCMRIRYSDPKLREGLLFYCQMSITDNDPIEIQSIRNRFPSFPDEPTVNQFYTEEQVTAYRALGYHIANRLCNELQSWQDRDTDSETTTKTEPPSREASPSDARLSRSKRTGEVEQYRDSLLVGTSDPKLIAGSSRRQTLGQPLFDVLMERLLTAYRLACYEELSYRKDDIFSEAIWVSRTFAFPAFRSSVHRVMSASNIDEKNVADRWLSEYEKSADVRSAYRTAVIRDINELNNRIRCFGEVLWSAITEIVGDVSSRQEVQLLAAHLTSIATACQEVHSGRPHSTFQIGGRNKLVQLCDTFAKVVCSDVTTKLPAGAAEELRYRFDATKLVDSMDQLIAELIELERSVFQGGEHVTTISFAQCMGTMWGRIARLDHEKTRLVDDIGERRDAILQDLTPPYSKNTEETPSARRFVTDFQVTELRHRLDIGLKRTRVRFIREALVRCWCIGYFEAEEIQAGSDFEDRLADQGDQKIEQEAPSAKESR